MPKSKDSTQQAPADETPKEDPSSTVQQSSGGKTQEELVNEVLGGRYGDHDAARKLLSSQGYDASAVLAGVNLRLTQGAPHAYELSHVNLLEQVKNGEWGPSQGLKQRLQAVGFSQPVVAEVLAGLDKE